MRQQAFQPRPDGASEINTIERLNNHAVMTEMLRWYSPLANATIDLMRSINRSSVGELHSDSEAVLAHVHGILATGGIS